MYLSLEPNSKSLTAINTDADKEDDFEHGFVIDESQIVKFPVTMGVNGFAF